MAAPFFSELHEAAVEYALAGYPIFPCVADGKQPAVENGFRAATTDIEQINAWWKEDPNYNPATEPERTGHGVIDVEAEALEAWERLQQENGGPRTFANGTPRGGRHYWYAGTLPASVKRMFTGYAIDSRGRGSYVLLPPAIVGGKSYSTVDWSPIAPLPDWIAAAAVKKTSEVRAASDSQEFDLPANIIRARAFMEKLAQPVQGQRNDATYKAACRLKDLAISPATVLEMLLAWAPLSEDFTPEEVEGRVISAFENGQNAPGTDAVAPSSETFAKLIANAPVVSEKPPQKSRFHMADEDEQDAEPAAQWQADGIFPRRGTMCVYGPSGAYKSFLLLDAALGVAAGTEAWGAKVQAPGTVIYGALEGRTALARERRPAWRMAKQIKGKLPFYVTRAPMLGMAGEDDEFIAQALKKHEVKPIRLIIFETAAKMLVGCDATKDVPRLVSYCEGLAELFDCLVIVSHHAGHDVQRGPKDSTTYHQGFDNVIAVTTPARGSKVSVADVMKFKDFPEPDKPFTFEGKPVANSLVFQRTTTEQHAKLTKKEDPYAPGKVGAALKVLNAVGADRAVTTAMLASQLHPPGELETIEDHEAVLRSATKRLGGLSKTLLAAYCTHNSHAKGGTQWHLP